MSPAGRSADAIDAYERLIELCEDADDELLWMRDDAVEGLERLNEI